MGLIKGKIVRSSKKAAPVERQSCEKLAVELEVADATVRRHAAQRISLCLNAAPALIDRLKREENAAVREAILNSLLRLHDPSIGTGLAECLRSEDAALRNDVIEAFKQLRRRSNATILRSLLSDPDPDVRIFAVNILNSERHPDVSNG